MCVATTGFTFWALLSEFVSNLFFLLRRDLRPNRKWSLISCSVPAALLNAPPPISWTTQTSSGAVQIWELTHMKVSLRAAVTGGMSSAESLFCTLSHHLQEEQCYMLKTLNRDICRRHSAGSVCLCLCVCERIRVHLSLNSTRTHAHPRTVWIELNFMEIVLNWHVRKTVNFICFWNICR